MRTLSTGGIDARERIMAADLCAHPGATGRISGICSSLSAALIGWRRLDASDKHDG
jgi:hypothetical protein